MVMIDFIYKLDEILPNWPLGTKWSLPRISEATSTAMPHVIQYLSEGLEREVDVGGLISQDEARAALESLSYKFKDDIVEREKIAAKKREKALQRYEKTHEKVVQLQLLKDWHGAFRTLSYFTGQYEAYLPPDILVYLCSETVRSGIKAAANIQEIGHWLEKAVLVSTSLSTQEGIADSLDLIDAYGEFFQQEESGKGQRLLGNILAIIEEPAARFELWNEFKTMVDQLYLV